MFKTSIYRLYSVCVGNTVKTIKFSSCPGSTPSLKLFNYRKLLVDCYNNHKCNFTKRFMSLSMRMFHRNGTGTNHRYAYSAQTRKFKEKNILSAMLGTATIVVLCASLVEPVWFRLEGGKCCHSYLGVNTFFGRSSLVKTHRDDTGSSSSTNVLCDKNDEKSFSSYDYCLNIKTLTLIQVITVFCILAIGSSLFSFVLDIIAPRQKPLWKVLKRYSFGYIFTVLLCATTIGFCYWASQDIYEMQVQNKKYPGIAVRVTFDAGVYMVTGAGGIAILATASNLMRQYPTDEEEQAERLLEEDSEDESEPSNTPGSGGPPPYAP